jgi:uncharacterized protein
MPISRRNFIKTTILTSSVLVLADAFWAEKFFIETNEFFIGNATRETDNIKVVQISDLHLQSVSYQLVQLTKKLNKMQPDLIVITGDAIDKAENISILDDFLKLISHNIKKVAILGNWEYWGNVDLRKLEQVYGTNNAVLLKNNRTQFQIKNKTVTITGIDDYLGGNADIKGAMLGFKNTDYHIVLNHCPEYNDWISEEIDKDIKIDFILSGHTHGGQVNLLGFIPFLPQGSGSYVKGWYNIKNRKAYVSKGIGTSILPVRFGARAEIAIFNLIA